MSPAPRPRRVRPFPLAELPRLLRAQVDLAHALWRHLGAVLDGITPPPELEKQLGGALAVTAAEPYLIPLERARALLQQAQPGAAPSARLLELERLTPAATRAVLLVDETLCSECGLRDGAELARAVRAALHGAALRVTATTPEAAQRALGEPDGGKLLALDLDVRAGAIRGWARLFVGSELRLGVPPPPSPAALRACFERRMILDGVRVPLRIEAGYGFLPGRAVAELRPGDIVVLDHFGPKPVTGGSVWLRLGGGAYTAHLDGAGVTLLSAFNLRAQAEAESLPMTQEPDQPSPTPTAPAGTAANKTLDASAEAPSDAQLNHLLRELPVQLTCEIGRVTLSAREVLELRPGAVLPVGRPLAGPVDLTAGGRVLARGELVDVEGEIGVRITELVE